MYCVDVVDRVNITHEVFSESSEEKPSERVGAVTFGLKVGLNPGRASIDFLI